MLKLNFWPSLYSQCSSEDPMTCAEKTCGIRQVHVLGATVNLGRVPFFWVSLSLRVFGLGTFGGFGDSPLSSLFTSSCSERPEPCLNGHSGRTSAQWPKDMPAPFLKSSVDCSLLAV